MNTENESLEFEDFVSGKSYSETHNQTDKILWEYVAYLGGGLAILGTLYAILGQ